MGKKVTISGVGGKMATAGCREKLRELLGFMKMEVMENSTGAVVNPEAWQSGKLVLSEDGLQALKAQADEFLAF